MPQYLIEGRLTRAKHVPILSSHFASVAGLLGQTLRMQIRQTVSQQVFADSKQDEIVAMAPTENCKR